MSAEAKYVEIARIYKTAKRLAAMIGKEVRLNPEKVRNFRRAMGDVSKNVRLP